MYFTATPDPEETISFDDIFVGCAYHATGLRAIVPVD